MSIITKGYFIMLNRFFLSTRKNI